MRTVLAISVALNAALAAGLCWKALAAHAAGAARPPTGSGDVNGDGTIDISDAAYTLSWLFTGGPAPVPTECPPPVGKALPATGQTKCTNDGGGEIECDSPDYPGQDGFYKAGCPSEGRFVDNGDGTVTDHCTGLMWQKETADVGMASWREALAYCEALSFAGHDDWRLPNVRELQSIVDYGRYSAAIDPIFLVEGEYWSSTSSGGDPGIANFPPEFAWQVSFVLGTVALDDKDAPYHVRAVRNVP